MTNEEKLMVCISCGPNGERLIDRGSQLAEVLESPLYVLAVTPAGKSQVDLQPRIASWQAKCSEQGATLIVKQPEHLKITELIAKTAKEHGITQLILGQCGQTRWQEITQGSIVNELLKKIEDIDLHVVSVERNDVLTPASVGV
ncbi:hypothetical protein [Paenibacillus sp. 1P07SE]|uniref:hypothetical protein n=1 Tax=Paenibacillus sp. 1P07SE TaxID=3132209 RepID=UPI0039A74253